MKIGLVCPYNIFRGGGVQECVHALQEGLKRRGHDVIIITPTPRDCPDETPPDVLFLGGSTDVKSFHTTAQVSFTANTEAVEQALDEHKFDILHFHEPWVPMMSRQLLSRSTSLNMATFHAKLPDTVMSRTIEKVVTPYTRSVLKYLDELTAVSDAAAAYVKELTDEPIDIVPNGIDLKKYQSVARKSSPGKKTVLFIGRLEKRKGVKYLLKAYQLLEERLPEVRLVIAGDGPDRQKLEQQAAQLGLNHVEFAGYVSEERKLKLLSEADLFCSPALYGESFGIVLLEAMACGLPLVAGDNPGYSAVMQGRGRLSLVNPKYSDEFARRLETFLVDEELRDIWLQWARQHVIQYDYDNVIDQYEKLYQQLLRRGFRENRLRT
jgi:phosphatidyl-myo-inositol alpha-mannosyltransferase